jgi:hypothetical protein
MTRVNGFLPQTFRQSRKLLCGEIFRTNPPIHLAILQPLFNLFRPARPENSTQLLTTFLEQEVDGPCQFPAVDPG